MCRIIPILILAWFTVTPLSSQELPTGASVGEVEARWDYVTVGKLEKTKSGQKSQVLIEGGEGDARAAISGFFRSVKNDFRNLFRVRDGWVCPININVSGKISDIRSGKSTALSVRIPADNSIIIDIKVSVHANFDNVELERTIVEALLLERMMSPYFGTTKMAGKSYQIPDWLVVGTTELIRHRSKGSRSDAYAGIARSRELLPVEHILTAAEPESTADTMTREIYSASASALVAALIEQGEGAEGARNLFEFLSELPFHEGKQVGLLRANFPGLRGSPGALDKWWTLQLAQMGKMSAFEFYTWQDTDQAIRKALQISIPAEKAPEDDDKKKKGMARFLPDKKLAKAWEGALIDFSEFIEHPYARRELTKSLNQLEDLRLRGFPLYRRVVTSYQSSIRLLLEDDRKGVKKLIETNDLELENTSRTMQQVTDVMNHQEATGINQKTDEFERWRAVRKKLDEADRERATEGDPFAEYLRELEKELE